MPLNILKHKSYHVSRADNLERVRRDEEAAAKKEEEQRKRERAAKRASQIEALRRQKGLLKDHHGESFDNKERDRDPVTVEHTKEYLKNEKGEHDTLSSINTQTTRHLPYASSRSLSYNSGSVMANLYKQPTGGNSGERNTKIPGTDPKSYGPPPSMRKKSDTLVKQEMDPMALMLQGVEKTKRYEQKEKRRRIQDKLMSSDRDVRISKSTEKGQKHKGRDRRQ